MVLEGPARAISPPCSGFSWRCATSPLAVIRVGLGCPEGARDIFPDSLGRSGPARDRPGELPARAAEKLVRLALGDRLRPERVAEIVERAAGNAFFLEEMIGAVAEGRGDCLPARCWR